jgi:hypothetical protein
VRSASRPTLLAVAFGHQALLWPLFEKSEFFEEKKGKEKKKSFKKDINKFFWGVSQALHFFFFLTFFCDNCLSIRLSI